MADDVAIRVSRISKAFKLPHEKQNSIKGLFVSMFRGRRTYERQQVLRDVSFDIKKGEFFGIVGRNGSGKSTLLKLLSGIYAPDKGHITVNGKLTPFIELGVGFNPELTGRENVFLNGALLGFNRTEMEAMYKEIVDFAELEKFMDQKLKNYSSGMQVRLAFSIAIRANTEILVLDEVLAVGDAAFQEKCEAYFKEAKKLNKTIVLVSHNMKSVQDFCTRALVLSEGSILGMGDPEEMAALYNQLNIDSLNDGITKRRNAQAKKNVLIKKVGIYGEKGTEVTSFKPNETIITHIEVVPKVALKNAAISLRLYAPGLPSLLSADTNLRKLDLDFTANSPIRLQWELPAVFNSGTYSIGVKVYNTKTKEVYLKDTSLCQFEISGWSDPYHLTHLKTNLSVLVED